MKNYLSESLDVKVSDIEYISSQERFIVEGDIVYYKADVSLEQKRNKSNKNKLASNKSGTDGKISQRWGAIVSGSYAINIRVKNNCTTPSWHAATAAAIKNYNLPGLTSIAHVRFVEVTSGLFDIVVSEVNYQHSNSNIFAVAAGPTSNKPGSTVEIFNNHNNEPLEKKILVITHELGHTIGLKHTNSNDGSLINGTPPYDVYSFMNAPNLPNNSILYEFKGFSNNDLIAISKLYPRTPANWIKLPGTAKNVANDYYYLYATELNPSSNGNHNFKRWNGTSWGAANGGPGIKIVSTNSGLYYITSDKKIFMNSSPYPIQLPGEAIDITANEAGELYIVNNTPFDIDGNMIMKWNGSAWVQFGSVGAKKIAVGPGPNGQLWRITNSKAVSYHLPNAIWSTLPMQANEIAISSAKISEAGTPVVFAISNTAAGSYPGNYTLMKWTGEDWYTFPGAAGSSVSVDVNGRVFHTNTLGEIYWHPEF